jgi:hypothetical protein
VPQHSLAVDYFVTHHDGVSLRRRMQSGRADRISREIPSAN